MKPELQVLCLWGASAGWNAVSLKKDLKMCSKCTHTKIEQCGNGTFPKELFHSFSSVSSGCDRLDLSHDRAYSVIAGMSQESDSGNPVEGICSDTFSSCHLSGTICRKKQPLHFHMWHVCAALLLDLNFGSTDSRADSFPSLHVQLISSETAPQLNHDSAALHDYCFAELYHNRSRLLTDGDDFFFSLRELMVLLFVLAGSNAMLIEAPGVTAPSCLGGINCCRLPPLSNDTHRRSPGHMAHHRH